MRLWSNWYQIGNKTCQIPKASKFYVEKKISMLAGFKVSHFACKRVFYRQEHNANGDPIEMNFKGLEMHKPNMTTDRVQRVDEKMESFVQLSRLRLELRPLKCHRWLIFCVFC